MKYDVIAEMQYIKKTKFSLCNKNLTLVNPSRVKSTTFPAVIVNRFCDLSITNNKIRLSVGGMSYQSESYTASPIDLL